MLIYSTERRVTRPSSKGSVGGFADRVKGITFTYYLAKLIGREFAIEWRQPDQLEESFAFPKFQGITEDFQHTSIDMIDKNFTQEIKLDFLNNQAQRFTDQYNEKDIIKINCNSLPLDVLHANQVFFNKLGLPTKTYSEIFKYIFDTILIYRPQQFFQNLQNEFNSFLDKTFTIGVQFRLGGDANGWDDPVIDSTKNITNLIEAIKRIATERGIEKYNVYITSDSHTARNAIIQRLNESGKEAFYLDFDPIHIDKQNASTTNSDVTFVYFDNYLLSQCDLIVVGQGFFGRLAAYRTGKTPYYYRDFCAEVTKDYNDDALLSKIFNWIKRR